MAGTGKDRLRWMDREWALVCGVGSRWDEVVIPEVDFVVIENTLGKSGTRVETFNRVPNQAQSLVGRGCDG